MVPTPLSAAPGATSDWGEIAYGCWRLPGATVGEARETLEAALGHGLKLIDTADIYGYDGSDLATFGESERLIGSVLGESSAVRRQVVIATKGGIKPGVPYHSEPSYLAAACEASRDRLGVERIDLYQVHRPDYLTHPAAVADALAGIVEAGLAAHVGVSNYSVSQADALGAQLAERGVALVSSQPELSPLKIGALTDGVLDQCMHYDRAVLAWSPLGAGRLVTVDAGDADLGALVEVLDRIASDHGVTRTAVILAWVMAHASRPIPIVGTQRIEHIAAAATAHDVELSPAEWYEIFVAARDRPGG